MLLLSLPPHGLWPLAWAAFVPSVLAQFLLAPDDRSARFYQAVTYTCGIGPGVLQAFPIDLIPGMIPLSWPIGLVIVLVGVLVYALGLPTGNPSFHRQTGFRLFVIGPAVAWAGFEFLRALVQLGHVWGMLATSQSQNRPLWQLPALGGPWLLSLLIVAANYALALAGIALLSPRDRTAARRPAFWSGAIVLLLLGAALLWGGFRSTKPVTTVRVAALQPGRELGDVPDYMQHWSYRDWAGLSREVMPDMAALTRQAAAQGAELVVWPEAALWLDPRTDPWTREQLGELARQTGAALVIPCFILPPESDLSWWLGFAAGMRNEAYVVTPEGEILPPYAKDHPIPYIGERSSTRGLYPVHQLSFGQVGTMLGYDTAFTDTARRLTRRGGQLLTLSTHDWASMTAAYGVHTRLRAVENGVAVVKADWQTGSLIADPWGQIVAAAPMDRAAAVTLVADVPLLPAGGTPFTHLGDVVGCVSLAGTVLYLGVGRLGALRK